VQELRHHYAKGDTHLNSDGKVEDIAANCERTKLDQKVGACVRKRGDRTMMSALVSWPGLGNVGTSLAIEC